MCSLRLQGHCQKAVLESRTYYWWLFLEPSRLVCDLGNERGRPTMEYRMDSWTVPVEVGANGKRTLKFGKRNFKVSSASNSTLNCHIQWLWTSQNSQLRFSDNKEPEKSNVEKILIIFFNYFCDSCCVLLWYRNDRTPPEIRKLNRF